ncbi:hypothetical protein [Nocardia sp. NPDC051832]|uniref:SMP-30/gluconolactonase/LRE family protein n=1 Tax=Nocardia sp. NPDC051832 TaxID=3155673 RepID=UPI003434327E
MSQDESPDRPVRRRWTAGVAVALGLWGATVPGPAGAQDLSCAPAIATTAIAASIPALDWSENIGFDAQGGLWISRTLRNEVQGYDRAGNLTTTVAVPAPGAIRLGRDNLLYVNSVDVPNLLPPGRGGAVLRFDPAVAAPTPEIFVSGLGVPNGAAFDSAGYLYVGDLLMGVVRVRPDGTVDSAWTARSPKNFDILGGVNGYGINGVAVVGDSVFAAVTVSATGRILRVPIDASHPPVAIDLAPGMLSGPMLPDDLVAGSDGMLYVVTATGQLVRVDPGTGSSCTVLSTMPMTAVAFTPESDQDLLATTEHGSVLRVRLTN